MTIHGGSDDRAMDFEPRGGAESWGDDGLGDEGLGDEEPVSEEEFAEEVRELVAEDAPRVFALVEEYGERDDARVYAWGIAFDNHVEVINASGGLRMTFKSVELAQRRYSRSRKIRLVWTNPAATSPPPPRSREKAR